MPSCMDTAHVQCTYIQTDSQNTHTHKVDWFVFLLLVREMQEKPEASCLPNLFLLSLVLVWLHDKGDVFSFLDDNKNTACLVQSHFYSSFV